MTETVPRWEWRLFARKIEIQIDLEAFHESRHIESAETYLVSGAPTANPKIRDGKVDIKTLERVDGAGLEQWKPAMKAEFPLSADQVTRVYEVLSLPPPALDQTGYGLDTFLALIDADDRVRAVALQKVRDQYDVEGCTVELSDVFFDGQRYQTVAAENANPDLVLKVVGMLGFEVRKNMSYVKFINEMVGFSEP
jgi:exopolyphosphatase/guanosine-5'-triphosphate,3'-diphosphate pyrophosphatase